MIRKIFIVIAMLLCLPHSSIAIGLTVSGTIVGNVYLEIENNLMTLSGTGKVMELTTIGFGYIDKVRRLSVGEGITDINNVYSWLLHYNGTNTILNYVELPGSLKKIEKRAFTNFKSLTEVKLADGIEEIGEECFYNCYTLQKIKLPSTIKTIHTSTFQLCKLDTVVIPPAVKTIESKAFKSCVFLKCVIMPDSLEVIGESAFYNCALDTFAIPPKVTVINVHTFRTCSSLRSIAIGDNVETIYRSAFDGVPADMVINNDIIDIDSFLDLYFEETDDGVFHRRTPQITSASAAKATIVATEEYSLNGEKSNKDNGLKVVRTVYSDGTTRSRMRLRE